jgi:hypothetical protein
MNRYPSPHSVLHQSEPEPTKIEATPRAPAIKSVEERQGILAQSVARQSTLALLNSLAQRSQCHGRAKPSRWTISSGLRSLRRAHRPRLSGSRIEPIHN